MIHMHNNESEYLMIIYKDENNETFRNKFWGTNTIS